MNSVLITLKIIDIIASMRSMSSNYTGADSYKRESLSFKLNEYMAKDIFKKSSPEYPICSPATNLDCNFWTSWTSARKVQCPSNKIWLGVGEETFDGKIWGMTQSDLIVHRGSMDEIPESWKRDDCTITGVYGTPNCKKGDFLKEKRIQVIRLRSEWVAVKTVSVLLSEEPYAKTCWQNGSVSDKCADNEQLSCKCLEYPLHTLYVRRGDKTILVDGVGTRTVQTISNTPDIETGSCDLIYRDGEWFIETDRDLNNFMIVVRKGSHEIVCQADELGHLCYGKGWSRFSEVLKVKLFMNGLLYASCSADDAEDDFCKQVSYFYRWKHYQCWGFFEHIALTMLAVTCLTLTSLVILTCCYFWSQLCTCMLWVCMPIKWASRLLRKRSAHREDIIKMMEEGGFSSEARPSSRKSLALKKAALGILLGSQIKDTRADCTSLEFLKFSSNCNSEQCTLTGVASALLPSKNGVACFDVRSNDDRMLDLSYELHIDQVYRKCVPYDSYWSSDYYPKACSQFYCPSDCWSMNDQNKWEYLRACSTTPNTLIIKQTHQGCAGVSCVRCDDACVLYTKFFVMTRNARPVKVFKCQDWVPEMKGMIIRRQGFNSTSRKFKISVLEPYEDLGIQLQWNGDTSQFSFFQMESFIQDGERYCVTHASRKGNPVKGQFGYVQCASQNETFMPSGCLRLEDQIGCNVENKATVFCTYLTPRMEDVCKDKWLPIERSGVFLTTVSDLPAISVHDFGLSRVSFKAVEGEIARFIEPKSSCKILDAEVTGCHSCDEGAILHVVSQPINGAPVVRVSCDKDIANFRFICGQSTVRVFASSSSIDVVCRGFWGIKSASFHVRGNLIEQVDLPKLAANGTSNQVIDKSWEFPSFSAFTRHILIGFAISLIITLIGVLAWCRCKF